MSPLDFQARQPHTLVRFPLKLGDPNAVNTNVYELSSNVIPRICPLCFVEPLRQQLATGSARHLLGLVAADLIGVGCRCGVLG